MAKQNKTKWDALSMKDRASFIRIGIKNGITDLEEIKREYNKYADGGEKETVYAGYIPEVNITESSRKLPNPNTPKGRNQSKFYVDRISKGDMDISGVPEEYRESVLNYLKSKPIEDAARDRKGYEKLQEFAMAASGGLPGIVGDLASKGAMKVTDYGLDLLNTPEDSKFRDYAKFIAALGAGAYVGGKTAWYDPGTKESLISTIGKAIETTSDAISGTTKTIVSPQYRRNHAFSSIMPAGYKASSIPGSKNQFERIKDYFSSMLLDKPIDLDNPSWYSDALANILGKNYRVPEDIAGQARIDAWRIYNHLPQKYNTYIKNLDGTYSYDLSRIPKELQVNSRSHSDFITGSGGGLQGNAGVILDALPDGTMYELRTIKDVWDAHPFSRTNNQFSDVLGRKINEVVRGKQDSIQKLREKLWDKGIFGMPYKGMLPKLTSPLDRALNRFRMKDFSSSITEAVKGIRGMKKLDEILARVEVGNITGGTPFTMMTDIPITYKPIISNLNSDFSTLSNTVTIGIDDAPNLFRIRIPKAKEVTRRLLKNNGPRRFDTVDTSEAISLLNPSLDNLDNLDNIQYNLKFADGGTLQYNTNNVAKHEWTIEDSINVIKQFEGYRNKAYQLKDGNGNEQWLGGYGHALTPEEIKLYSNGTVIPDSIINAWLNKDIESKRKNIKTFYGDNIPEHAEALLLSLAYQGGDKLIRGARESDNTDGKGWSPNFEKAMIRYMKNPSKVNIDAVIDQMQYRDDVLGQGKDGLTSRYGLYRAMLDGTADPKKLKEYYDNNTFRHYRSNKVKK